MMKEIKDMSVEEVKEFVIEHWQQALKKSVFELSIDDLKAIERRMNEAAARIEELNPPFWKNLGERIVLTFKCPDGMNFEDFVKIIEETVNEYENEKEKKS